jgi:serine/threonine protein kinase
MKTCPQCSTGYPDSHTTCPTHGVLLNEIRDLKPGMVIRNTYRIVRKLGQGGMGAVYLAQHTLMNEPQALKFLSSDLSHDEAFTARFLREVRTLRQIRHKNVVDAGNLEPSEDGTLFFSMEFVDGPDLRAFLNDAPQPFDVPLALSITRQIAEGLGAAHAKGMVHRDIKPENILMARDGDAWLPKIADFGIVATKESSTAYTRTGGTLLTMAYAAPEQWRGTAAAELDGRTDLYALGGLLYEMLTGQTPFQAENYEGWARQHQSTPPQPPSTLRPDLANWQGLDALVLRLLAKDRNDRSKDVAELLGLIDAVRYLPSQTHMETLPMPRAQGPYKTPEDKTPKPSRVSAFLRRKWPRGIVIFLAAVFAASAILGIIAEINEIGWTLYAVALFPTLTIIAAWMRFGFRRIWVIAGSIFLGIFAVPSFAIYCLTFFIFFQAYSGNLVQCRNMAGIYLFGEFTFMMDTARSDNLYRRACDGGDSLSCMTLGDSYLSGRDHFGHDHEKNYAQAEIYYTKALNGDGNIQKSNIFLSLRSLAYAYSDQKDDAHSASLFKKICDLGDEDSCITLGYRYATGIKSVKFCRSS